MLPHRCRHSCPPPYEQALVRHRIERKADESTPQNEVPLAVGIVRCPGIMEVEEALRSRDTDPCLHTPSILSCHFGAGGSENLDRRESDK